MSAACISQRQAIIGSIVSSGIGGVLWLSADLHWGQFGAIDPGATRRTNPLLRHLEVIGAITIDVSP